MTQDFRVGLTQNKSFTLVVDVYASKAAVAAADQASSPEAEELVDTPTLEIDPEAPVEPSYTL